MKDYELFEKSQYIVWRKEAKFIKVSQEEFKDIYMKCVKKGKEAKSKSKILDWINNYTYCLDKSSKYWTLRTVINGKFFMNGIINNTHINGFL